MRRSTALLLLTLAACGDSNDPAMTGDTGDTGMHGDTGDATDDPNPTEADPTDTGGSADSGGDDDPVWDTPYCYSVHGPMKWPEPLPSWETEVVELVNAARATGGDCRSEGEYQPAPPLTMNPSLHCAARVHSKDMADRDFFDHTNPDGDDPFDRMAKAGYGSFTFEGENIAAGTMTPKATVDGWLASDGHCANMLSPNFKEIGVGAYEGGGEYVWYWTQTFGAKN